MHALDGTGLAKQVIGGRSRGAGRGPLAAALLGIALLCCLLGPVAAAGASPASQARQARAALQQAELNAADAADAYAFGRVVAVDGDTALVGAPARGDSIGAVYVFVRDAGSWAQQQVLTPADGVTGTRFGSSVALVGDMALIGAMGDATTGQESVGAAYIFIRYGGMWTQRQKLSASDGVAGDNFGCSVALSGDTALVGAQFHDIAGKTWTGAAYVFVAARPVWVQQAKLTASDGTANDVFGCSVALSGDTALVGARFHSPIAGNANAGAAYVFVRSPGATGAPAWTQQTQLKATAGASYDKFGASVALDGDTALIGAPEHDVVGGGGTDAGAAYVFTRFGALWTQQAQLTASDAVVKRLRKAKVGSAVAVDGGTALVGAPGYAFKNRTNAGGAFVFTRSGSMWIQQQMLSAADARLQDALGTSVGLSGDTALVGAPKHMPPAIASRNGAAYVFLTAPTITVFKPAAGPAGTSVAITGSYLTGATAVAFNGTAASFIAFGTAITATVPAGATTGPITVSTPLGVATSATDFTVIPTPTITSFTPISGPPGTSVFVTGTGFDDVTLVTFNGVWAANFSMSGGTQITATVSAAATSGPIAVITPGGTATSAESFTVTAPATPAIVKLKPASGKRGAIVTIAGSGFGATRGTSFVKFGGKKCAEYMSWSDALIKCMVPAKASYGAVQITVTTAGGTSNAKSFTVKH